MPPRRLTEHLLTLFPSSYKAATTHPFLQQAGRGTLSPSTLQAWLLQDRLYALHYISFISTLLSKISQPSTSDRSTSIQWRTTDCLIDALINIRREIGLFEDILRREYNWGSCSSSSAGSDSDSDSKGDRPRVQTRAYMDLFSGAVAESRSLLIGMTVLWATERCYLDAWRWARDQSGDGDGEQSAGRGKGAVLRNVLIPNWSSDEFESFVSRIGGLLDELAAQEGVTEHDRVECEEMWRQVLWAETNFWPDVNTKSENS